MEKNNVYFPHNSEERKDKEMNGKQIWQLSILGIRNLGWSLLAMFHSSVRHGVDRNCSSSTQTQAWKGTIRLSARRCFHLIDLCPHATRQLN